MTARRVSALVAAVVAGVFLVAVLTRALGGDDPEPRASASPSATASVPETFARETTVPPVLPETTASATPLAPEPPAADCGRVAELDTSQPPKHRTRTVEYDRAPPNSGTHHPVPVPMGGPRVYTVDDAPLVERVVHNLEHGYVVVWYDPARADLGDLAASLGRVAARKMFATPWTRSTLPAPYVVTAWGREQRCDVVTSRALETFFADHGGANGAAPEPLAQ